MIHSTLRLSGTGKGQEVMLENKILLLVSLSSTPFSSSFSLYDALSSNLFCERNEEIYFRRYYN